MERKELVESITFGQRVAEDEPQLEKYFVETPLWRKIVRGEVDIIYGSKGSGKSAIFHLLTSEKTVVENVIIIPAENPRGTPIFNGIKSNPPTTEMEFIYLWKLYILSLIANQAQILVILRRDHPDLLSQLNDAGVINVDKSEILKNALKYVGSISIPNIVKVDLNSEVNSDLKRINPDSVLGVVDKILSVESKSVWVAFDRLDSVFDADMILEENALRALFKSYLDLLRFKNIQLKIFLRTDIWYGLTKKGFREASHITRHDTIDWSEGNIVNLICKRLLNNQKLIESYSIDAGDILSTYDNQIRLFYRIYPQQVDQGEKRPETMKWMISRVIDSTKKVAPRELIHLLIQTKDEQVKSFGLGEGTPEREILFSSTAIKRSLGAVSKARLDQTIFAEFPDLKKYILSLKGEKTEHSPKTLSLIWGVSEEDATAIAFKLSEIGFFEIRGDKNSPQYWIPFIYRPELSLIQGKAEE